MADRRDKISSCISETPPELKFELPPQRLSESAQRNPNKTAIKKDGMPIKQLRRCNQYFVVIKYSGFFRKSKRFRKFFGEKAEVESA